MQEYFATLTALPVYVLPVTSALYLANLIRLATWLREPSSVQAKGRLTLQQ